MQCNSHCFWVCLPVLLAVVKASEIDHALQNLEQQVKSLQDQLQGKANRIDILESELGTERATTKVSPVGLPHVL